MTREALGRTINDILTKPQPTNDDPDLDIPGVTSAADSITLEETDTERAARFAPILDALAAHQELLTRAIPNIDPAARLAIRSAEIIRQDLKQALTQ